MASSRRLSINIGKAMPLSYELVYVTDDGDLPDVLAWCETQKTVGLDLETSDLFWRGDFHIATIQLGNPTGPDPRAYVIDVRCVTRAALQPLLDWLASDKAVKLGQNIKFECLFLQHQFGCRLRRVSDTQVAELVIRAGLLDSPKPVMGPDGLVVAPKKSKSTTADSDGENRSAYKHTSMGALAQRYLGVTIDKDHWLRTSFAKTLPGHHDNRQLNYAAGDVVYPFFIAAKQRALLEERALRNIAKVEFELIPVLADTEITGMRMDVPAWRALWVEAVTKRAAAERECDLVFRQVHGDLFGGTDGVRPLYLAGKATNSKPKSLNYDSAEHKKWAITQYCGWIGWHHQIVTTVPHLTRLKREWGMEWLTKRRERVAQQRAHGETVDMPTVHDIPEYVIPTHRYCILIDCEKPTLMLAMIRGQLPEHVVRPLLEYSKYSKRVSTYGIEFLEKNLHDDGRVHQEIHQCITNTGRLSGSPNLMNIPKDVRYRRCFVPGEGRRFITADYSQIEPRLSAQLTQDAVYNAAFAAAEDLYIIVATEMFGERPDLATDEGALRRQIAKVIVLGLAYGMGAGKLCNTLTLALGEDIMAGRVPLPTFFYVRGLYDTFFAKCSGIKVFQELQAALADPKTSARKIWDEFYDGPVTWVTSPCGRHRFFPAHADNTHTEATNAPIQGGSATITKLAAVYFQAELYERGWEREVHIVNFVHDELVAEAPEALAAGAAVVLRDAMERAGRVWLTDVPCIAEFPKGTNGVTAYWAKEIKDEELLAAA